jgi:uncharacterized OsmC-like protein
MPYTLSIITRQEVKMKIKLTLRVEEEVIKKAKHYSKRKGSSISKLFEKYINGLTDIKLEETKSETQTPTVTKLRGILKGFNVQENDYKKHLEEKYL